MTISNLLPTNSKENNLPITLPDSRPCSDLSETGENLSLPVQGQTPIACPSVKLNNILSFAFDTLHISLDLFGLTPKIIDNLKYKKELLQLSDEQECVHDFLDNNSGLFRWNLQRTGAKMYPFVLRTGDLTLFISTRSSGSKIPNAKLQIGSISCHQDVPKLIKDFRFWFSCIDVTFEKESVSRFDVCADFKQDITKTHLDRITRFVTRARDSNVRHSDRKFNSVSFGSGSIMCRIYNKPLELIQKKSQEKSDFFHSLWSVDLGTPVTRVEFQLRREGIVQFFSKEKTTVADIYKGLERVWSYLTASWLRHCSHFVDRNNSGLSILSEFWKLVQLAPGFIAVPAVRDRGQKHIDIVALRKQARGIYVTILAGLGIGSEKFFTILDTAHQMLIDDLSEYMRFSDFHKDFSTRQTRAVVTF